MKITNKLKCQMKVVSDQMHIKYKHFSLLLMFRSSHQLQTFKWWCNLLYKKGPLNLDISSTFGYFQLDLIAFHNADLLKINWNTIWLFPLMIYLKCLQMIAQIICSRKYSCLCSYIQQLNWLLIIQLSIREFQSCTIFGEFITQLLSYEVFTTVFSDNCSENFENFPQEHGGVLYYSCL